MKKYTILFTLVVVFTTIFSGCSNSSEPVIENLSGTKWRYQDASGYISLNFYTETSGTIIISVDGDVDSGSFSYTYSKPNVNIKLANGSMSGSINGNTMSVSMYNSSGARLFDNLPFSKQ